MAGRDRILSTFCEALRVGSPNITESDDTPTFRIPPVLTLGADPVVATGAVVVAAAVVGLEVGATVVGLTVAAVVAAAVVVTAGAVVVA